MKAQTFLVSKSITSVVGLLVLASVLSNARPASAQEACPLTPGLVPPEGPRVTVQQVDSGSASLMDFALAARDRFSSLSHEISTIEQASYFGCLVRQEGTPYRSGSTYLVQLTPDGRILVHAKAMALSGRKLNPLIYGEILSALGVSPTDLANLASPDPEAVARSGAAVFRTLLQQPHAPFDATTPIPGLRPRIPGASGYAAVYFSTNFRVPILLLTGFDLNESHLAKEVIDYGNPTITAKEVVARETLKAFVTEAGEFLLSVMKTGDAAAISRARTALRDPNGPWRHGSVYVYVLERISNIVWVHGAFPDRFELRPLVGDVRDTVTGKPVLPQVIAAANSDPECRSGCEPRSRRCCGHCSRSLSRPSCRDRCRSL